jgi:hypothetical protein
LDVIRTTCRWSGCLHRRRTLIPQGRREQRHADADRKHRAGQHRSQQGARRPARARATTSPSGPPRLESSSLGSDCQGQAGSLGMPVLELPCSPVRGSRTGSIVACPTHGPRRRRMPGRDAGARRPQRRPFPHRRIRRTTRHAHAAREYDSRRTALTGTVHPTGRAAQRPCAVRPGGASAGIPDAPPEPRRGVVILEGS